MKERTVHISLLLPVPVESWNTPFMTIRERDAGSLVSHPPLVGDGDTEDGDVHLERGGTVAIDRPLRRAHGSMAVPPPLNAQSEVHHRRAVPAPAPTVADSVGETGVDPEEPARVESGGIGGTNTEGSSSSSDVQVLCEIPQREPPRSSGVAPETPGPITL